LIYSADLDYVKHVAYSPLAYLYLIKAVGGKLLPVAVIKTSPEFPTFGETESKLVYEAIYKLPIETNPILAI